LVDLFANQIIKDVFSGEFFLKKISHETAEIDESNFMQIFFVIVKHCMGFGCKYTDAYTMTLCFFQSPFLGTNGAR